MISNPPAVENNINDQIFMIQQLTIENGELKDKIQYLEGKITQLINEKVQEKLKDKKLQLSQNEPLIS
jgi:predicted RNase H-like nuclease (RuvC/YqgF family)